MKKDRRWRPQADSHNNLMNKKELSVMKKVISLILVCMFLLSACGSGADGNVSTRIAIVQQMDHASLDEIRTAIEAELNATAAEKGIDIIIDVYNGQNDASVLTQIGTEVVSEGYNAIIPIATLAAEYMVNAAEGNIPVIFAAVSDPETAGLTGMENVTGTSDALNTAFIIDMMFALNPDIQTMGLLYSNSEPNSQMPIAQAKEILEERGIPYLEKTGNTSDEIITAASSLVGRVDAVFTPTDNVVMGAETAVAEILNEAGIPHYTGADSFVGCGAFAASGVNYTELGTYTAQMAMDVLLNGNVPEYHVMEGGIITVNTATAAALGLDYSVFSTMANTVKEVE